MGARESGARTRKRVLSVTTHTKKIKNQSVSDRLSDLFIKRAYRSVVDVPSSWVACSGPTPLVVVNRWPACQKYNWLVNRTAAVVNAAKAVVSFSSPPPPFLLPPPRCLCWVVLTLQKRERKKEKKIELNWHRQIVHTHTHSHTQLTNMHTHKCIHNICLFVCVSVNWGICGKSRALSSAAMLTIDVTWRCWPFV